MGGESDDEEATAGMEITLSNVQLRPFIFFTGQGELMSHVWAGNGFKIFSLESGFFLTTQNSIKTFLSRYWLRKDQRPPGVSFFLSIRRCFKNMYCDLNQ